MTETIVPTEEKRLVDTRAVRMFVNPDYIDDDDLFAIAREVGLMKDDSLEHESDLTVMASAVGILKDIEKEKRDLELEKRIRSVLTIACLGAGAIFLSTASIIGLKAAGFFGHDINIGNLPKDLPTAVQKYVNSAGEVGTTIYDDSNKYETPTDEGGASGSGLALNNKYILTAGHMLINGNGVNLGPGLCQTVNFVVPGDVSFLRRYNASFNNNLPTSVPDVAVMKAQESKEAKELPTVKIAKLPPSVGEALFFINYEPQGDGVARNPLSKSGPAVYGGIYEGQTSDEVTNNYEVITGVKSYGKIKDASSRAGSSGGAVFNSAGELVGISTRSDDSTTNVSTYDQNWNVHLQNSPVDKISDDNVQPVSSALIHNMEKEIKEPKSVCTVNDFDN